MLQAINYNGNRSDITIILYPQFKINNFFIFNIIGHQLNINNFLVFKIFISNIALNNNLL